MTEIIKNINIDLLIPFENHPFKKRDGMENEELKESVKENGLLEPIIVRSFSAGTFEIISGHRRVEVCRELEIQTVPAIVRDMSKDEAVIAMVDSNLQREHLLPSEKAFAYKMKLEAMKHQGKTYGQVVHKSRDNISDNESGRQVQRYIRLTHLIPELLKLVDEGRIAFTPAVELSYLPENEQKILAEEIEYYRRGTTVETHTKKETPTENDSSIGAQLFILALAIVILIGSIILALYVKGGEFIRGGILFAAVAIAVGLLKFAGLYE